LILYVFRLSDPELGILVNIDVNSSCNDVDVCITVTHRSHFGLSEAVVLYLNTNLGTSTVVDMRLLCSKSEEKDSAHKFHNQLAFSHVIGKSLPSVVAQVKSLQAADKSFRFSGRTDETGACFSFRFQAKAVHPSGSLDQPPLPPPPTSREIRGML
jgi:hypothetical protein